MRVHLWPDLLRGVISCLAMVLMAHNCRVDVRLVIHRLLGEGRRRAGNSVDSRIRGIPSRLGLKNWSKKVRFMVRVKGGFWWFVAFCWRVGLCGGMLVFWVG